MKVSQLIEELQTFCQPDDDIIVDYWLRDSFTAYNPDTEKYDVPTVEVWAKVVKDYNDNEGLYTFLQGVINDIIEEVE
jgi:hypothetical protein